MVEKLVQETGLSRSDVKLALEQAKGDYEKAKKFLLSWFPKTQGNMHE